ncbi:hypothetical protein [Saccharothrix sp.]|uniref:hypothetical protein n=1 Tax=Saccharothrix sp. TaxID=1873460 RepID=UPI002811BB10|nr:hypothetical protein [Saccharothrix sp.]
MGIDKYFLNLAGEYRVAAELLKREVFATITYGNRKGADIYAIGANRRTAVIEVKASNTSRFVTSFYQKYADETKPHPDFWVLYSLAEDRSERFFVLTHGELAHVQAQRNHPGQEMSWADRARAVVGGVDNVLAGQLAAYEECWHKIVDYCSAETA